MKPCRLKDCKVTSLQSLPRPGMDRGPHSIIAVLAVSDKGILIIFDHKILWPITLLKIVIESSMVPHLKDLINNYLKQEDQDPSRTFKVL